MEDIINEAVDKAIANLDVDNLTITKEQIAEIKKKLANNEDFITELNDKEKTKNDKHDRRNR